MPPSLFNTTVNVYRRTQVGTDSLNNPIYGMPTSGIGWAEIYANMPVRLAFSSKQIQFARTGENPEPSGIVYYGSSYLLQVEDRILTSDAAPIEYVVTSVEEAYNAAGQIDHWESVVSLPI
jgi:hypothetical protein